MSAWHLEELKVHLAEILMGGILQESAPRARTRAAMEFSSFRNAIGIEATINVTMSKACRRLTPLSRFVQSQGHLAHNQAWGRILVV
jgi:hypothetical protein